MLSKFYCKAEQSGKSSLGCPLCLGFDAKFPKVSTLVLAPLLFLSHKISQISGKIQKSNQEFPMNLDNPGQHQI